MVPLVKASLQTPPRMQRSWSDDDVGTLEAVVESYMGMNDEPRPSVKGSPKYYHG